jgi:hypothetical protein
MSGTDPLGKNAHDKPTAPPIALQGDLANLPEALTPLKETPNWVCWKWEWRADNHGGGKWTKPPFQPHAPQRYAKNDDPSTWGTYEQALAAFENGECDGIGFNLLNANIPALDIDKCRDKVTGAIAPEALAIINRAQSYTEITPSGTGLRVIGTGSGDRLQRKQKIPGSTVEVESYRNCARYITISGNRLPDTPVRMTGIDKVIDAVVAELNGVKPNGSGGTNPGDPQDLRSDLDKWIAVNGNRHARTDDFKPDDRYLPPELKALIANVPEAPDLSAAFYRVVCWLHYDLKWSAKKIDAYIYGEPVVPQRYEGRLEQEIYRCLCNAERNKESKAKANTTKEAPQAGGIALEFFEDFEKTSPKRAIIKGVIYKGERSSWVGPPGSGKSALLADLAIHAAEGTDWRGHRCKEKVAVVYFALERKELVKRRLRAHAKPTIVFEMKDGTLSARQTRAARAGLRIAVAGKAIDLLNPTCIEIIVETVRAAETHYGGPVGLIIIDTFNKGIAMGGGDENMAKDQNLVAANLQQIQDMLTDIHVALIGHTGKDESRGARGSNAHLGDVDMMVQISVAGAVRTAALVKINDGVESVLTWFQMTPVTLGRDEDGDDITTAIVSDEVPKGGRAGLNRTQQRAMEALELVLAEDGKPAPATPKYPKGVTVVTVEQWRGYCYRCGLSTARTDGAAKKAFSRAMSDLLSLRRIGAWDNLVWIVPE